MSYPNTVAGLPGTWSYLSKPARTGSGEEGGYKAKVTFLTDYANHTGFITTAVGVSSAITTSWGSFNRVQRLLHPEYSGLYLTKINWELCGKATGNTVSTQFSHCKVNCEFQTVPYGISGDTAFMTLEVDQGSNYTTQPGRKFTFASGEPLDQDAGTWAVLNTYILTLYNVPSLNNSTIDSISGTVNNATFMGYAAGSLLFGGCRSVIQTALGGVTTYQKSYQFTYRSYSWNQAYKRDGTLDSPLDPASNPPYNTSTFTDLLN